VTACTTGTWWCCCRPSAPAREGAVRPAARTGGARFSHMHTGSPLREGGEKNCSREGDWRLPVCCLQPNLRPPLNASQRPPLLLQPAKKIACCRSIAPPAENKTPRGPREQRGAKKYSRKKGVCVVFILPMWASVWFWKKSFFPPKPLRLRNDAARRQHLWPCSCSPKHEIRTKRLPPHPPQYP
jgi:hypothetical protein